MNCKKILAFIFSIILVFCVCGCDSSDDEYSLYIELDDKPSTLDPQLVSGTTEEIIVRNMFEGLTRMDGEGNIQMGVAESVEMSDDGLTYVFTIRNDAKWSNGDSVTADDFVFAFERAVAPETKSPSVALLYSIKNAQEISGGKTNEKLGVTALDDTRLKIVLKEKNSDFLKVLTYAVCMPCNRSQFQKAKGKYGMNDENIVSNGSYSMGYWNTEETFRIKIKRNAEYNGSFVSEAAAVFFSVGSFAERAEKLNDNNIDMGFVDYSADIKDAEIKEFSKTVYSLLINSESAFGKNEFKNAVMLSAHRNLINSELNDGLTPCGALMPLEVKKNNTSVRDVCSVNSAVTYDPDAARESYLSGIKKYGDPGVATILFSGGEGIKEISMLLAENLQQALGIVANVKQAESDTELLNSISNGEYTLAIIPITVQSNSLNQYLSRFCSENDSNIYRFSNSKYDNIVNSLAESADMNTAVSAANDALKILNESRLLLPLADYTEAFGMAREYSCPVISPFYGVIDMALVKRVA